MAKGDQIQLPQLVQLEGPFMAEDHLQHDRFISSTQYHRTQGWPSRKCTHIESNVSLIWCIHVWMLGHKVLLIKLNALRVYCTCN